MILWNLVPEKWRHDAFIAGGYAACPALASDCDLWIYVDARQQSLQSAREDVIKYLESECIYLAKEDNVGRQTQYHGVNVNILKVGYVYTGKRTHIMVVDAPVNAVLEGFDVSTHQIALLSSGEVLLGSHWTPITEDPIKLIDTPHTDERMEKIRNRYRRTQVAEAA